MNRRSRKKKFSIFIPAILLFLLSASIFIFLFQDKMDEAMMALVLFAIFPFVIVTWISDALARGAVLRGRWLSLLDSASSPAKEFTRKDNPFSFWLVVILSFLFALAILAFVVLGIYARLTLKS